MGLFGNSIDSSVGNSKGHYFIIGRVKNIVLGEYLNDNKTINPDFESFDDLGKITFEMLYSSMSHPSPNGVSKSAYPMFGFMKQYPLLGEIVLIVSGPSHRLNDSYTNQDLYYYPPFNIWRNVNHNVFPNLESLSNFYKKKSQHKSYPGQIDPSKIEYPKGYTFTESDSVRSLRPFEGDSLIEGRFGQSIRFGSTVNQFNSENYWSDKGENGSPITIMVNGQRNKSLDNFATIVENINDDDSSIYMTSGQNISITDVRLFPFDSFGKGITNNISDKVILTELPPLITNSKDAQSQDQKSING